jgi:hypothetical protein
LWEALSDSSDATYIKSPASKKEATVRFPVDITGIPAGAKIVSITVKVRCNKTSAANRSLTVNTFNYFNCARYFSRTIYPTETIADYEVATYRRDSLGHRWDHHRLNKLLVRMFSYSRVADGVRVYKAWVEINYKPRPEVVIDSPTGTITTPSPTVQWTYSHEDGDVQGSALYKIFTASQVANAQFSPDHSAPQYSKTVQGESFFHIVDTSLGPDSYYIYLRSTSAFGAQSLWASKAFSIVAPAPGVPGDDNAGVAGTPGVGKPTVVPDSATSSATLTFRDASNLLDVQQADFEQTSDYLGYTTTNCAIARDATQFFSLGTASLSLTASSAATMAATSTFVELDAAVPVTIRAQFKSAVTARTVNVVATFYDVDFAQVGSSLTGTGTDGAGTWTEVTATGTTPAGTAYAKVKVEVVSSASAEVHNVDHVGIMYGTNSAWTHGGHMSHNVLDAHLSTGDDPVGGTTWIAGNAASSVATVATSGTGSHGDKTYRMTYTGVSPTLGFRAAGTVYTTPSSGTNYTLNKPAGVADNDLLVAFVTSNKTGGITPPAGWSSVNSKGITDDSGKDVSLWVLKRTGLAADPATWTDGVVATSSTRRTAVVVAYSGAAAAADQFIAENVNGSDTGGLVQQTAVISNTDSNAWRVSAFAVSDNATGSTMTANDEPPASSANISFVGTASKWTGTSDVSSYTINRPSGVVTGDLMLAMLSCQGVVTTVTPPSGWTLVRQTSQSDSSVSNTLAVMKRTAGASEPTSWSGTLSSTARGRITQATAYRNCKDASLQFIAENTSIDPSGSQITTATVSNTNSRAWRVSAFSSTDPADRYSSSPNWTSSEAKQRSDGFVYDGYVSPDYAITAAMFDSNASVSTGSHSRVGYFDVNFYAACSWIGLIAPLDTTPAPGANETERVDNTNGSADPWLTTSVYDSNGVVPAGDMTVYGTITPGSGTAVDSCANWIGLIKPADAVVAGEVEASTSVEVDISDVDPTVLTLAGNKVSMVASFLGSTAGTPYLILDFYRANQNIGTVTAEGTSFNSTAWVKSYASFDLPEGTTRIVPSLRASDRAISDTVSFDRVGVSFGETTVWRNGTGRAAHPIWSIPRIQYADDDGTGFGDWTDLAGQSINPPVFDPLHGYLIYTDHTIVPLRNRKYRIQTISYGMLGDTFASGWGPESGDVSFTGLEWWLKDIKDPTLNMAIEVQAEPTQVGKTNTASVFQPLGADYPVVLTEGYKADSVELTMQTRTATEFSALRRLLQSGRTLLLQSDVDHAWWVRPVGDMDAEIQVSGQRREDPVRFIKTTFVEVEPEA